MKRFVFALSPQDRRDKLLLEIVIAPDKFEPLSLIAVIAFALSGSSRFLYIIFCSGNICPESYLLETMCTEAFILVYVQAQAFAHVLVHVHVDVLVGTKLASYSYRAETRIKAVNIQAVIFRNNIADICQRRPFLVILCV
jgi:hypothetical protein